MKTNRKEPKYDEPISPEDAKEYVNNYLHKKNFKPSDFTAFYFHTDEILKVIEKMGKEKYLKFTIGLKKNPEDSPYGKPGELYGCIMMSNEHQLVGSTDDVESVSDGEEGIYDFSHPVPPYPPPGEEA